MCIQVHIYCCIHVYALKSIMFSTVILEIIEEHCVLTFLLELIVVCALSEVKCFKHCSTRQQTELSDGSGHCGHA